MIRIGLMIVWLASFPRSGSTLSRALLRKSFGVTTYSVYGDKADIAKLPTISEIVGHVDVQLEASDLEEMRDADNVFFVKTHELPNESAVSRVDSSDFIIHLVRNPLDVYFSFSKYLSDFSNAKPISPLMLSKQPGKRDWSLHTALWAEFSGSDRYVRYQFETLRDYPELFNERISRLTNSEPSLGKSDISASELQQTSKGFVNDGTSGKGESNFDAFTVLSIQSRHDWIYNLVNQPNGSPIVEAARAWCFANGERCMGFRGGTSASSSMEAQPSRLKGIKSVWIAVRETPARRYLGLVAEPMSTAKKAWDIFRKRGL